MVYYFTLLTVAYLAGAGFVLLNIFGLFTLVMETEKMDENEWDYHGEGNKSMIVAHSQVKGNWIAVYGHKGNRDQYFYNVLGGRCD